MINSLIISLFLNSYKEFKKFRRFFVDLAALFQVTDILASLLRSCRLTSKHRKRLQVVREAILHVVNMSLQIQNSYNIILLGQIAKIIFEHLIKRFRYDFKAIVYRIFPDQRYTIEDLFRRKMRNHHFFNGSDSVCICH